MPEVKHLAPTAKGQVAYDEGENPVLLTPFVGRKVEAKRVGQKLLLKVEGRPGYLRLRESQRYEELIDRVFVPQMSPALTQV